MWEVARGCVVVPGSRPGNLRLDSRPGGRCGVEPRAGGGRRGGVVEEQGLILEPGVNIVLRLDKKLRKHFFITFLLDPSCFSLQNIQPCLGLQPRGGGRGGVGGGRRQVLHRAVVRGVRGGLQIIFLWQDILTIFVFRQVLDRAVRCRRSWRAHNV